MLQTRPYLGNPRIRCAHRTLSFSHWCLICSPEHIQWVSEALTDALRDVPSVLDVEIRIFVTGRGAQAWDDDSLHKEDAEDKSGTNTLDAKVLDSPYAKLDQGRPDLRALLDNVIEESAGLMSVNGTQRVLPPAVQCSYVALSVRSVSIERCRASGLTAHSLHGYSPRRPKCQSTRRNFRHCEYSCDLVSVYVLKHRQ